MLTSVEEGSYITSSACCPGPSPWPLAACEASTTWSARPARRTAPRPRADAVRDARAPRGERVRCRGGSAAARRQLDSARQLPAAKALSLWTDLQLPVRPGLLPAQSRAQSPLSQPSEEPAERALPLALLAHARQRNLAPRPHALYCAPHCAPHCGLHCAPRRNSAVHSWRRCLTDGLRQSHGSQRPWTAEHRLSNGCQMQQESCWSRIHWLKPLLRPRR
mmetsp:Transcript_59768/g.129540  ORF Transcript_59768/g.129540 Transcript_59768/m.129540 type:complete len:220 (-) Transcript_59768:770-1429(-)